MWEQQQTKSIPEFCPIPKPYKSVKCNFEQRIYINKAIIRKNHTHPKQTNNKNKTPHFCPVCDVL